MLNTNSTTANLVANYLMENRDDLTVDGVISLIDFSTWARIREEDEYVDPSEESHAGASRTGNREETGQLIQEHLSSLNQPNTGERRQPVRQQRQAPAADDSDRADVPALIMNDGQKPTAKQIKDSITGEFLVSFLDGRKYKTLRSHLGRNGLHADSYRERFGLPADYPMVAPEYSERRSELAKQNNFGGATNR